MEEFSSKNPHFFYPKKILRILENRRIVLDGSWMEQEAVAKIFIGLKGNKEVLREKSGYAAMQISTSPLPELLHYEENKDFTIFIYEKIKPAATLKEIWSVFSESEKLHCLKAIALILAGLHQMNFIHQDLHFCNIIAVHDKIYLLDYGAVRKIPKGTALWSRCHNLALFLSQIPNEPGMDYFFLEHYFKKPLSKIKKIIFSILVHYQIRKREKRFLKKIFRDCTAFRKIETQNYSGVCLRKYYEELLPLVENPEQAFKNFNESFDGDSKSIILKNGNSSTVIKYSLGQKEIVIKRYNIKNFLHYIKKSFRKPRAWYSWRNSHLLEFYDIPTAPALAWFKSKKWNSESKGYFICDYLEGENALDYVGQAVNPAKAHHQLDELIQKLHRQGLTFGDTKATNIIFVKDTPYFIDMDAVGCSRLKNKLLGRYQKDWDRLKRNWASS